MAMKQNLLAISSLLFLSTTLIFLTFASLWCPSLANTISNNGISFKLHHRYSLEPSSSVSKTNTSHKYDERFASLVAQSHFRAKSFQTLENEFDDGKLSPRIYPNGFKSLDSFVYAVEVGIGTFDGSPSYQPHFLRLDPSKPIIWTQCENCTQCFSQRDPLYPKSRSKSYNLLDCDDIRCPGALCHHSHQNYCSYDTFYTKESIGEIARETFTFVNDHHDRVNYTLKFGCGFDNHLDDTNGDENNSSASIISGVLALGNSNLSLVGQLNADYFLPRRFSYCLQPFSRNTNSDINNNIVPMQLRVGVESSDDDHDLKAAMMKNYDYARGWMGIYVTSLSVNEKILDISPFVFVDGSLYNVLMDAGTAITHLVKEAYVPLKAELIKVLSNYRGISQIPGEHGLDLCYEGTLQHGEQLPNITFATLGRKAYRTNGDFVVQPEAGFYRGKSRKSGKDIFCLAIVQNLYPYTIIGAYQQTNKLIIYDYQGSELIYKDQDCNQSN